MKGRFTKEEAEIFHALESKKLEIQKEIDSLLMILSNDDLSVKQHREAKEKIRGLRPKLVPFAELQAALADANSRDRYFPDMSKNQFLEHIKKAAP